MDSEQDIFFRSIVEQNGVRRKEGEKEREKYIGHSKGKKNES